MTGNVSPVDFVRSLAYEAGTMAGNESQARAGREQWNTNDLYAAQQVMDAITEAGTAALIKVGLATARPEPPGAV